MSLKQPLRINNYLALRTLVLPNEICRILWKKRAAILTGRHTRCQNLIILNGNSHNAEKNVQLELSGSETAWRRIQDGSGRKITLAVRKIIIFSCHFPPILNILCTVLFGSSSLLLFSEQFIENECCYTFLIALSLQMHVNEIGHFMDLTFLVNCSITVERALMN